MILINFHVHFRYFKITDVLHSNYLTMDRGSGSRGRSGGVVQRNFGTKCLKSFVKLWVVVFDTNNFTACAVQLKANLQKHLND